MALAGGIRAPLGTCSSCIIDYVVHYLGERPDFLLPVPFLFNKFIINTRRQINHSTQSRNKFLVMSHQLYRQSLH